MQESISRFLGKSDDKLSSFEKQKKTIEELEDVEYVMRPEFSSFVNFSQARSAPIHRWFKYREGYSPDLVNAFLSNQEKRVLDPFCGCGTTLVCSMQKGIDSIGIDINPLATFVSSVKTRHYTSNDIEKLRELSKDALDADLMVNPAEPPELKIINKVFPEDVLDYLLSVKAYINSVPESNLRDFLFLGWLAILESVSNTRKEGNGIKYRSTRRTKKGYVHIPFDIWQREYYGNDQRRFVRSRLEEQFNMMLADINRSFLCPLPCKTSVHRSDAVLLNEILNEEKISLAIFSPPYANCFDYFEIFKVELWMGNFIDSYAHLKNLRKDSFGSLWQMHRDNNMDEYVSKFVHLIQEKELWDKKIISMLAAYFSNMRIVLSKIYEALFPKGRCVIVVGNSAYSNILIPTDLLLARIGRQLGFRSPKLIIARHLTTSSQQKKKLTQLKQYLRESIIVLEK
jgi:hypothetical protein